MALNADLREQMLPKDPERDNVKFSLTAKHLSMLFENENIKSKKSLQTFKDYGGKDGLLAKLKTSQTYGIKTEGLEGEAEKKERISMYDSNKAKAIKTKSIWELMVEQLSDHIIIILIAAAIVSLIIGIWKEGLKEGWIEGLSISIAVVLVVAVSSGNNYVKEQQFRKLMEMRQKIRCTTKRNGSEITMDISELLVGDILTIGQGDQIPADTILLSGTGLTVNESALTGESKELYKKFLVSLDSMEPVDPFLKSGSIVQEGSGEGVVCAVGPHTEMGSIQILVSEDSEDRKEQTPLQRKLQRIADGIGLFGTWFAALIVLVMTGNLIWDAAVDENATVLSINTLKSFVTILILGITVIVVAIPEGLPLAVTLALAYSVGKMKDQNNLVRQLNSCETMGGANNILTDKTGTLTMNIMTAVGVYTNNKVTSDVRKWETVNFGENAQRLICENSVINSTAKLLKKKDKPDLERVGNPTELALLSMAYAKGYKAEEFRIPKNLVHTVPFDSKRKSMITVMRIGENQVRVYVKGAPDFILPYCKNISYII